MKKIFLILTILVLEVKAYPIFFKCDSKGTVSNILQPAELVAQLKGLADVSLKRPNMTAKKAAEEACSEAQNCIKELVQLTGVIRKAGQLDRDLLIQKIEAKAKKLNEQIAEQGAIKISESDHTEIADLNRANVMSYSCREITNEIDPKNFQDDDTCVLGNFHHSPYMYLSGARFSGVPGGEDKGVQDPVSCAALDSAIDSAVAMGQDPYAALAISFMENGTNVAGLYLDPIGLVGALGCPAQRVSADAAHKWNKDSSKKEEECSAKCAHALGLHSEKMKSPEAEEKAYLEYDKCNNKCDGSGDSQAKGAPYNLESYETFYKVQYGVVQNGVLSNRIKKYIELQSPDGIQKKSGFICGEGSGVYYYETAQKDQCCLATQFMPKDVIESDSAIEPEDGSLEKKHKIEAEINWYEQKDKLRNNTKNAFTFNSLKQYVQAPLSTGMRRTGEGENAARRIQRFNGYSDLMGGAESVSAWRSGVNYNNNPAYGYQAMDFVYNSLMSNPMVVQKIEAAQKKYGSVPSIVCADRPAGAYYTSSDLYFNKHAQSTRMDRIQKAWDSGVTDFKKLSRREQNVLKGEFSAICDGGLATENLRSKLGDQFQEACISSEALADYSKLYPFYMKNVLPLRRTVAQASEMDQGYTWKNMTDDQYNSLLSKLDQVKEPRQKMKTAATAKSPFGQMEDQAGGFEPLPDSNGKGMIIEKEDDTKF